MKTDLSGKYCGNKDKQYPDGVCRYYDHIKKHCSLLLHNRTSYFWDQCRIDNFALLYELVNINFKSYKLKNPFLHVDEAEDFDFQGVVARLKAVKLRAGYNLPVWVSIMKKTVFREVRDNLYNRGLLPRVKKCGSCRHLTGSKPYMCSLYGDYRKKTDQPCDEYVKISPIIQSMAGKEGSGNELLSGGFSSQRNRFLCNNAYDRETIGRITVVELMDCLCKRAEYEEAGSKKKKMRKRQYEIFINLMHTVSEGSSVEKAVKKMAVDFNINRKTVKRDIKDIRLFFKNKVR